MRVVDVSCALRVAHHLLVLLMNLIVLVPTTLAVLIVVLLWLGLLLECIQYKVFGFQESVDRKFIHVFGKAAAGKEL
jgi:hypothetical protein